MGEEVFKKDDLLNIWSDMLKKLDELGVPHSCTTKCGSGMVARIGDSYKEWSSFGWSEMYEAARWMIQTAQSYLDLKAT